MKKLWNRWKKYYSYKTFEQRLKQFQTGKENTIVYVQNSFSSQRGKTKGGNISLLKLRINLIK